MGVGRCYKRKDGDRNIRERDTATDRKVAMVMLIIRRTCNEKEGVGGW